MYGNSTHTLPRIDCYAAAHKHFTDTKKPPRSVKWSENQRPLKNTASYHYRLEKRSDDAYDVVLYQTVMARYYKPDAQGNERRLYRGHYSNMSQSFMHHVLRVGRQWVVTTTEGKQVIAPVYNFANTISDAQTPFSADLWFTPSNKLIVEKSQHTPHYKYVSSDDDKGNRKEIRDKLSNYVMLAVLRMPELQDNVTLSHDHGRPFSGYGHTSRGEKSAILDLLESDDPHHESVNQFFERTAQDVFDVMASKRAYNQQGFIFPTSWRSMINGRPHSTYADLHKPITEKEFERSLMQRCLTIVGANVQSDRKELPQFINKEDYPRSNLHV